MIYKPVRGCKLSEQEAQLYGERIDAIVQQNGGSVSREDVLDDARNLDSPLHPAFEWDDPVAAEQWRLEQARYLLRSINVVIEKPDGETTETRAFVHVNIETEDVTEQGPAFVTVQRALGDDELRRQLILEALARIEFWQKRYGEYSEFAPVVMAINQVREQIGS
jgi:hypothetical protein